MGNGGRLGLPCIIPTAAQINKRYGHYSCPIQPPGRYPVTTAVGGVALSTALFTTIHSGWRSGTAGGHREADRHDTMKEVGSVTQDDRGINNVHGSEMRTNQWLAGVAESADHERHDTVSPQDRINKI